MFPYQKVSKIGMGVVLIILISVGIFFLKSRNQELAKDMLVLIFLLQILKIKI